MRLAPRFTFAFLTLAPFLVVAGCAGSSAPSLDIFVGIDAEPVGDVLGPDGGEGPGDPGGRADTAGSDVASSPDEGTVPADPGSTEGLVDEHRDLGGAGPDEGNPVDPGAVDPGAIDVDAPDTGAVDPGASDPGASDPGADAASLARFSFFVTSIKALRELSGSQNGFGGDLRFGETGPGAGLRGADRICATIADRSMPGASAKQWRAFLSATDDGNGNVVNAIERIGEGPWYDRLGRVFATRKADLLYDRPSSANTAIKNDFPNEDGVPNHRPDVTQPQVDNHDMLTGTNAQGLLYSSTATCLDWTSAKGNKATEGKPRVGHSWPRSGPGGGGPGGGPGGPGGDDMANWMSALDEAGCAPGVNLVDDGAAAPGTVTVGAGGGYGGFYCFALTP